MSNSIIKISPSSIELLGKCHRAWYYRHIAKLFPKVQEEESSKFGNFIHEIAERFTLCTLEEYKKLVSEIKKKYTFDQYSDKVKHAVKNLYVYCTRNFLLGDKIEKECKYEHPYKPGFLLTGKLDVFHIRGNKVTIIDYKTSAHEKDYSFQLAFYTHLLNLLDVIKCDELECEIVYLCNEDKDELLYVSKYIIDKIDVQSAIAKIENLIAIYKHFGADKEKWKKKVSKLCDYCDYKKSNHCDAIPESEENN